MAKYETMLVTSAALDEEASTALVALWWVSSSP